MKPEHKALFYKRLGISSYSPDQLTNAVKNIRYRSKRDLENILRIKPVPERFRAWLVNPSQHPPGSLVGVEIECCSPSGTPRPNHIPGIGATYDGSVSGSDNREWQEVRFFLRQNRWTRLYAVCDWLNDEGASVNKSCGLHVHLDARHLDKPSAVERAIRLSRSLPLLNSIVPASRRNNDFCLPGYSFQNRYHAINGTALSEHGTIEVRLHSGTTDPDKIRNWIELLQFIFNTTAKIVSLEALLASRCNPQLKLWAAMRYSRFNPIKGLKLESSEN